MTNERVWDPCPEVELVVFPPTRAVFIRTPRNTYGTSLTPRETDALIAALIEARDYVADA